MNGEGGGASRTTEPAAGSSAATDVPLKEFLTEKIVRTNERIEANRIVNRDRFAFVAAIGGVVWFFIERHLSDLNHENARVAKVSEESISADTYRGDEQRRKEDQNRITTQLGALDAKVASAATKEEVKQETKTDRRGAITTTQAVVAMAVGVVVVTLAILNYQALHRTPTPTVTVTTTMTP